MDKNLYSLGMALLLGFATPAVAGVSNGGGGVALVCRQSSSIQTAYLLDLYEGSANGILLRRSTTSLNEDYVKFLTEMRRAAGDSRTVGQAELEKFESDINSFVFTKPGERLEYLGDTGMVIAPPKGCSYEQLAIYDDVTNKLTVDSEIWNALDPMNKVALFAHEVLYKEYRLRLGDWTSAATRKIVPLYFSTKPAPLPLEGVPSEPKSTIVCNANDPIRSDHFTRAHIYQSPLNPNATMIQFDMLFGLFAFAPIRIEVPLKIQQENLVQKIVGHNRVIKVMDQSANYDGAAEIAGGYFPGHEIGLTYIANEPFSISLWEKLGPGMGRKLKNEVRFSDCALIN